MKWGLLGVRLLMIAVNVFIVVIILLSFLPLAQGDITVDIPKSGTGPTFSNGVMTIAQPIEIYNGGYYNIQDFSVDLLIKDGNTVITQQRTEPQNIPTGQTSSATIQFNVDVNSLSNEAKQRLVFNSTSLDMTVGIHAAYTLGLVKLDIRGNETMLNEPIISNINIDWNAITMPSGGSTEIAIPYSFSAAQFVQGQSLDVFANLTNSTGTLGSGTKHITISGDNNGQMVIALDPDAAAWLATHSEELFFSITFDFYGASMTMSYPYSWNVGVP